MREEEAGMYLCVARGLFGVFAGLFLGHGGHFDGLEGLGICNVDFGVY